jgi:hypothetical protein
MFKFLWRRYEATPCKAADWRHDPLGHPALTGMSLRELADLPMVAEVPMRVGKPQLAQGRRRHFADELSARCGVSR